MTFVVYERIITHLTSFSESPINDSIATVTRHRMQINVNTCKTDLNAIANVINARCNILPKSANICMSNINCKRLLLIDLILSAVSFIYLSILRSFNTWRSWIVNFVYIIVVHIIVSH